MNRYNYLLSIAVILLCFFLFKQCEKNNRVENLYESVNDTLHQYRNWKGQQVSEIRILHGKVSELKALNDSKDSTILRLKKLVDKNTISATVATVETKHSGSTVSIVHHTDTVYLDSCKSIVFPVYTSNWDNQWIRGLIIASKDSIFHDICIRNEFDFKQYYKRDNWFSPKYPVVQMTNKNPYTETRELRSFTVKNAKQYKGLIFIGGIISGVVITKAID